MEEIPMDHVSMPEFRGFKFILDARCTFTGWVEAVAVRTGSSKEVIKFLEEKIVTLDLFPIQL
jgi:hypothetical protein